MSDNSIDCCITSPPYWQKRQYENGGIGLEASPTDYIESIYAIIKEIRRVLKPSGSFWLNIGDTYRNKSLVGIPWRIALRMIDDGWILRNNVIWNKHKGGLSPNADRFGSVFEDFFFFVKSDKYYFDADSIRSKPRQAIVKNGAVVSATGVSGIRYKRQIEMSTSLSDNEKEEASKQLDVVLGRIKAGEISDFRMVIRNEQRTTHSDSTKLSGRAKELKEKGFYFLFYNPKGTMPNDVWDIIPEDSQHRKTHYAPYPEELCVIPIKTTCPKDGVVLDPFSGTGTTMKVAYELGRKSVGIDLSDEYIKLAKQRICQESGSFLPFQ
jgi:site-specific DNA-methyltransferase (adenine-specific)